MGAQSFASVPPAPGWMLTMALPRSAGPDSMRSSSTLRRRPAMASACASASAMTPSSPSAAPSSRYSGEILDLAAEPLRHLELRLDLGALAEDGLGFFRIVPEPRRQRRLGQVLEHPFELGDVKDAPLAPQSAV